MDSLVARYVNPVDDMFAEEDGQQEDLLLSKPSFDHKFALPPIAQVRAPRHRVFHPYPYRSSTNWYRC